MSIVDEAIKTLSSEKVIYLRERLDTLKNEVENSQDFSSEKYISDLKELTTLSSTIDKIDKLENEVRSFNEAVSMRDDTELKGLAEEQISESEKNIESLMNELKYINQKSLPNDDKKAIFEIRPGVGGIEASLFAEELFKMYLNYIKAKSLAHEVYSITYNLEGGINEATFIIDEKDSFGMFRFEGGVHRVQRVPKTEAMGRIHTSTVSVVVVPKFDSTDIQISPNDIRIDVYRSSGPGGQSVNTTDSAVRITHLPTGIIVTCQNGKSQHKNKEMALSVLYSKLQDIEDEKRAQEEKALRKQSVDTLDRSSKIRTYNFPQSRITDHRINRSWFNINEVMEGFLDEIVPEVSLELRKED